MRVLVSSLLHLVLLIGGVVGRDPVSTDDAPPSSSFSEVAAETSTCRSDLNPEKSLSLRAKKFLGELQAEPTAAKKQFPRVPDTDPMKAYMTADKMGRQQKARDIWDEAVREVVDEKEAAWLPAAKADLKGMQVKPTMIKVHKKFNEKFFLDEKTQNAFKEIGTMKAPKWDTVQAVFVMGGRASILNREGAFQSIAGTIIDDFVELPDRDFKVYSHAFSEPNEASSPRDYVYTFGNEDEKIKAFAKSIQTEAASAKKAKKFVVIYYTYAQTAAPHNKANDENVIHAKKLKTAMDDERVDKSVVRVVHMATAASLNKQFWSEEENANNRFSIDCLKNGFSHYGVSKIYQSLIWADYLDTNIIKDVFDAVHASYDSHFVCSNDPNKGWSVVGAANFIEGWSVGQEKLPVYPEAAEGEAVVSSECQNKLKARALEIFHMVAKGTVHKDNDETNKFWTSNKGEGETWDIYSKQVWADLSHILFRETAGTQSVVHAVPHLETVLVTWVPTDPKSRLSTVIAMLNGDGFRGQNSEERFPENGNPTKSKAVQGAIIAMGKAQNLARFQWVTTPQMIARRAQKVAEDNFRKRSLVKKLAKGLRKGLTLPEVTLPEGLGFAGLRLAGLRDGGLR